MIDLKLSFHESETGALAVKAATQGGGESGMLPVDRSELERIRRQYERRELRGAEHDLDQLGSALFRAIFHDDAGRLYERARGSAVERGSGLRISFGFGSRSTLHTIPWELCHDGARFLAKRDDVFIVRAFDLIDPRLATAVAPPLRVLFTAASPRGLPHLDLRTEQERVRIAYQPLGARAVVTAEPHLSRAKLEQLFLEARRTDQPFHVWHHCGHGGATEARDRFWLDLEQGSGADKVSVAAVADIASVCPGLRLVVLNCCHGGSLTGLAPELARLNVPVAIGFPRAVLDPTAVRFATALHTALTRLPVEQAVGVARLLMSPGTQEWTLPLLLSRRRDQAPLLAAQLRDLTPAKRRAASPWVQLNDSSRAGAIINEVTGDIVIHMPGGGEEQDLPRDTRQPRADLDDLIRQVAQHFPSAS